MRIGPLGKLVVCLSESDTFDFMASHHMSYRRPMKDGIGQRHTCAALLLTPEFQVVTFENDCNTESRTQGSRAFIDETRIANLSCC